MLKKLVNEMLSPSEITKESTIENSVVAPIGPGLVAGKPDDAAGITCEENGNNAVHEEGSSCRVRADTPSINPVNSDPPAGADTFAGPTKPRFVNPPPTDPPTKVGPTIGMIEEVAVIVNRASAPVLFTSVISELMFGSSLERIEISKVQVFPKSDIPV